MNKRWVWVSLALLFFASSARAEQDFYGIQFRNEEWARYMVLREKTDIYVDDLLEGPVLDQAVYAEAYAKPLDEDKLDIKIIVYNNSPVPVAAHYDLRDFHIHARGGKKYSLVDTQEDIGNIDPKSKATFTPSAGNLTLKNSDIEMIAVSFDVGRTQLYLFPWSKKESVTKLVSPPPPAEPIEAPSREPKKERGGKQKRGFFDWLSTHKKTGETRRPEPETPSSTRDLSDYQAPPAPVQAAPSGRAPEPAGLSTQEGLDRAIKNFVYVPSSGAPSGGTPYTGPVTEEPALSGSIGPPVRSSAQIISYDKGYNFFTFNLGQRDGVQPSMLLSVIRDGQLVAKARVRQVREGVAAATVLPETMRGDVRPGDGISFA